MFWGMLEFTKLIVVWNESFQQAAELAAAIQKEETRMERYHERIVLIYAPADATIGHVQKFGAVVGVVSKGGEITHYNPQYTVISPPCPSDCPFHK